MGVLNLLTTQPKTEAIQVATKHIPYVESLWNKLETAQERQRAKEEYLRTASGLGIRTASLSGLADAAISEAKVIRTGGKTLDRIKRVLAAGAEPTTPPKQWFCGMVETPKKIRDWNQVRAPKVWPRETWPHTAEGSLSINWRTTDDIRVFKGAIPLVALQKLAATKPDLDDVRIYSPHVDDFQTLRNPAPRDPVMIGLIDFLGEKQYFEIARWDIDKDLAAIFTTTK